MGLHPSNLPHHAQDGLHEGTGRGGGGLVISVRTDNKVRFGQDRNQAVLAQITRCVNQDAAVELPGVLHQLPHGVNIGHRESLDAIRSLAGVEVQIALAHLRNGLLEVSVDDADILLLPAQIVGEEDGEGGLTHAALLIGKCDDVVHNQYNNSFTIISDDDSDSSLVFSTSLFMVEFSKVPEKEI